MLWILIASILLTWHLHISVCRWLFYISMLYVYWKQPKVVVWEVFNLILLNEHSCVILWMFCVQLWTILFVYWPFHCLALCF
jgi:hypothetical protein